MFRLLRVPVTLLLFVLSSCLLVACGGGGGSNEVASPPVNSEPDAGTEEPQEPPVREPQARLPAYLAPQVSLVEQGVSDQNASCRAQSVLAGGRSYPVRLTSSSGETISFQVMEPANIDCVEGHPLVLQGHGFGGQRITDPNGTVLQRLLENGYAVISIDQRGFNDSSGTVRVMDPNYEGRDLLQILDWAESHLDYLAHDLQPSGDYNLAVGATGGSYGGMFQLLLHNIDAKQRLDVLTPDVTPHDLRYSLSPNKTVKSLWALLLVAGGEAGANQPLVAGLDPLIKETLLRGATFNRIHSGALPFFYYHSVAYFTDASPEDDQLPMSFLSTPLSEGLDYEFPALRPKPVDVLFTQGMRDTLFNFNEGWDNYQAYKHLGGDVRLMAHESGHILPEIAGLLDNLGPASELTTELNGLLGNLGASLPEIQQAAGPHGCGELSVEDAVVGFLNEKLRPNRAEILTQSVAQNLSRLETEVCLSLKGEEAVWLEADQLDESHRATATVSSGTVPLPNSLVGLTGLLAPVFVPLEGVSQPVEALAGIGELDVTLSLPVPFAVPSHCELTASLPEELPVTGCDAIVYVGWGASKGSGAARLIDDQLTPLRGLGAHRVPMAGVAERLEEGESLGLLVHGYHLQYLSSLSRDLLVPAVSLSGSVRVPLLSP